MGKSTTAEMFRARGIPVWDADACVAQLYARGGAAVEPMSEKLPSAIADGAIDREALKMLISADPDVLQQIEAIVHPLVAQDRALFLKAHEADSVVLLDVPLLFETGLDQMIDKSVVVSVSEDTQRQRLLDRGSMSDATIKMILAKQMPDTEKRKRADYIIETYSLEDAQSAVDDIIEELTQTYA